MKKNIFMGLTLCAVTAMTSLTAFASGEPQLIALSHASEEVIVGMQQITVNGEAVDLSKSNLSQYIFDTNGNVMVPIRAVAEKMGYNVDWDGENRAVTVSDDAWKVRAYIGEDLYYFGVTKGADGAAAPQHYGTAPVIFEDTTFVPAKMFDLIGYSYHSIGQYVDFTNAATITDEKGQEYSNNTLIISVAADAAEADIARLFDSKKLEVINKMDSFNMYTVKLEQYMSADELDSLITELEKDKNITAANKNYIIHLDN